MVYVSFISEGDTYISQKYFYKNKALVFIKTEAIDKNRDSIFNEIYVKNDSIYYTKQNLKANAHILSQGLYYSDNFKN